MKALLALSLLLLASCGRYVPEAVPAATNTTASVATASTIPSVEAPAPTPTPSPTPTPTPAPKPPSLACSGSNSPTTATYIACVDQNGNQANINLGLTFGAVATFDCYPATSCLISAETSTLDSGNVCISVQNYQQHFGQTGWAQVGYLCGNAVINDENINGGELICDSSDGCSN
jgi:hypothetical protein